MQSSGAFSLLMAFAAATAVLAQAPDPASSKRFALVIGSANYPDANSPVMTAAKDPRSLADELRRNDFVVDERENAGRETMRSAIDDHLRGFSSARRHCSTSTALAMSRRAKVISFRSMRRYGPSRKSSATASEATIS